MKPAERDMLDRNLFAQGKRVPGSRGETFIATPSGAVWTLRLEAWKRSLSADVKPLPCPMPEGHIMFERRTS